MSGLDSKAFVVGLGAQKAGTTWLAEYLRQHPQFFIPLCKELHFFNIGSGDGKPDSQNRRFTKMFLTLAKAHETEPEQLLNAEYFDILETLLDRLRLISEPHRYLEIFSKRVTAGHRAFGEITPSYSLIDESRLQRIRDTHSKVKVIFLMRDPVGRIWSNLWFKNEKNADYDPYARWPGALHDPTIEERTRYDLIVPRIDSVFAPEEIYYGFFETIFTETAVRQLCDFLEIDYIPGDFDANPNPTRAGTSEKPSEYIDAVRREYARVYDFVRRRFGAQCPWPPAGNP